MLEEEDKLASKLGGSVSEVAALATVISTLLLTPLVSTVLQSYPRTDRIANSSGRHGSSFLLNGSFLHVNIGSGNVRIEFVQSNIAIEGLVIVVGMDDQSAPEIFVSAAVADRLAKLEVVSSIWEIPISKSSSAHTQWAAVKTNHLEIRTAPRRESSFMRAK